MKKLTTEELIDIIEGIESDHIADAMGDKGRAYGAMQIQQPCLDDYNRLTGANLKLPQLLGESGRLLSYDVFRVYTGHYATKARLGHEPTPEDIGRIWNGGPNGWRKSVTRVYGWKVNKAIEAKFPPALGGKKKKKKS